MSFGFGSNTSAFGAKPTSSPFGGTSNTSAFGASNSAFTPQGQNTGFTGQQNTAFAQQQNTFGAQQNTGFGSGGNAFGKPTNAFGASSTFGTPQGGGFGAAPAAASPFGAAANTGAFGGGNAFGQSGGMNMGQQQQQQSGFGGTPNAFGATTTTAFGGQQAGAFGGNTTSNAFGAKSAFGATTNAFGSGGASTPFGATNTATNAFGSTPTTNAFGGGSGAFGATTATPNAFGAPQAGSSPFGAAGSAFGSATPSTPGAFGSSAAGRLGTGNPPYRMTDDPERPGTGVRFVSICHMSEYQNKSPEELRYEDYLKKSDPAAAAALAGGATNTNAFGSANAATPFGGAAASPFGASAATSASPFGAPVPSPNAFGAPATSGAFGAPTPGAFGAPAANAFGTTPSAFGAPAAAAPATGFNFGGGATTTPNAFGAPAATPGAFGTPGGFGAPAAAPAASPGFGGGFGAATGAFGAPAAPSAFGTAPSAFGTAPSAFGAPAQAAAPQSAFSFAQPQAASSGFNFGGAAAAPTAATSLFPATAGATGGFGAPATQPAAPGGFSFGPAAGATPAAAPGGFSFGGAGGFGAATAQPSAFGTTTPAAGSTSLFGAPSATPGFGATTPSAFGTTTPSAFGAPASATPGGFGAATPGGLFGNSAFGAASPATGFGAPNTMTAAPQANQFKIASASVNAYGAGTFGAGLLQHNVQAVLNLPVAPATSASTVAVGLSRESATANGSVQPRPTTYRYTPQCSQVKVRARGLVQDATTPPSALAVISRPSGTPSLFGNGAHLMSPDVFQSRPTKALFIEERETKSKTSMCRSAKKKPDFMKRDTVTIVFMDLPNERVVHPVFGNTMTIGTLKEELAEKYNILRRKENSGISPISESQLMIIYLGRTLSDDKLVYEILKGYEETKLEVCVVEHPSSTLTLPMLSSPPGTTPSAAAARTFISPLKNTPFSPQSVPPRSLTYEDFYRSAVDKENHYKNEDVKQDDDEDSTFLLMKNNEETPNLTKPCYYTIPDLDTLGKMTTDELKAVEDFTVGCTGMGYVQWFGTTDVRNLDLDAIVLFEPKEIMVYPDDASKAPEGTELNKPALVQLENVFPKRVSKSGKKYYDRVKQTTMDIGATFIDYNEEKGIWTFKTEHFSRYGLDDDDSETDDDDNDNMNVEKIKKGNAINETNGGPLPYQLGLNSERLQNLRLSIMSRNNLIDHMPPKSKFVTPSFVHYPDLQPMMQSESQREPKQQQPESIEDTVVSVPKSIGNHQLPPLPTNQRMDPRVLGTFSSYSKTQNITERVLPRNPLDFGLFMGRSFRCGWGPNGELVHAGRTVFKMKTNSILSEMASPRLAYLENNQHEESIHLVSNTIPFGSCFRVVVEKPFSNRTSEMEKERLVAMLQVHYKSAETYRKVQEMNSHDENVLNDNDGLLHYQLPPSHNVGMISTLHDYIQCNKQFLLTIPSQKHTVEIFELVNALWGQERKHTSRESYENDIVPIYDSGTVPDTLHTILGLDLRRNGISLWFENTLRTRLEQPDNTSSCSTEKNTDHVNGLRSIFQALGKRDVEEACSIAVSIGDLRLATLLSQCQVFTGDHFRDNIALQLDYWRKTPGAFDALEPEMVRIYQLLCGEVINAISDDKTLPWVTAVASLLWYTTGPSYRLGDALNEYEGAQSHFPAMSDPSPYYQQNCEMEKDDDILYQLMQLYTERRFSLSDALCSSGYSPDPTKVEMSWHLHSILRNFNYSLREESSASSLALDFINQLECGGLWYWAVYVALNLPDRTERHVLVHDLLSRHFTYNDETTRDFLLYTLHIPSCFLDHVVAIRCFYQGDIKREIGSWIGARMWKEAHEAICLRLAPACIFSSDENILLEILNDIEVGLDTDNVIVSEWSSYGAVYLEYLRLHSMTKTWHLEMEESMVEDSSTLLNDVLYRVVALCETLRGWKLYSIQYYDKDDNDENNESLERICISSMLERMMNQAFEMQQCILNIHNEDIHYSNSNIPADLQVDYLQTVCTRAARSDLFNDGKILRSSVTSFVQWTNQLL